MTGSHVITVESRRALCIASPSAAHVVLQTLVFGTHEKLFAHAVLVPNEQLPSPSHDVLVISIEPIHEVFMQGVPIGQCAHMPFEHVPSVPQLVCVVTVQTPRGSGTPLVFTGAHVPFAIPVSCIEHAWHVVSHALSQQKPSTQWPLGH